MNLLTEGLVDQPPSLPGRLIITASRHPPVNFSADLNTLFVLLVFLIFLSEAKYFSGVIRREQEMAAMVETALNSQSGVNGARVIIKPESTLIWHSLHLLYLYDKLHQNENSNVTNCAPAGHFSAISVRATFPLALQSAETGLQLLCFPTAPTLPTSQTVIHLPCGSHLSVVEVG